MRYEEIHTPLHTTHETQHTADSRQQSRRRGMGVRVVVLNDSVHRHPP